MRLLVLSDIHGNLSALEAVLADARHHEPEAVALLGDYVDYGMRPNEVIARLAELDLPCVCALWGNHEHAILEQDFARFSSPRGAQSARFTSDVLDSASRSWIESLPGRSGRQDFTCAGKRFLAIHGSIEDPYWKSIDPGSIEASRYSDYDVVLSGHNHIPHAFDLLVPCDDEALRNKRRISFLNPGSVGQPRNRTPRAQYALWDSERGVSLLAVNYDRAAEESLYDGSIDDFYRARLAKGV